MDGVEKISYKMPKKDRQGKPTSEFQSSTKTKTIYDSSKISTDQYIKQGLYCHVIRVLYQMGLLNI